MGYEKYVQSWMINVIIETANKAQQSDIGMESSTAPEFSGAIRTGASFALGAGVMMSG